MANSDNRRIDPRIPCWANASLDWNGILETSARCLNVSSRGMAVETYDILDLKHGMAVMVKGENRSRRAEIRHWRRAGFKCVLGLEFKGS